MRKASVFCLVAIYSVIGEELKPHLAQLTGSKVGIVLHGLIRTPGLCQLVINLLVCSSGLQTGFSYHMCHSQASFLPKHFAKDKNDQLCSEVTLLQHGLW